MTSVFSLQNSVSLCPASFHTPRPNLPVTPVVSSLPTFAFWSPIMKRTSFFWCQFQKVLQVFMFSFSFFGISDWHLYLGYCDTEWFALERSQDHFVIFEIAPKYCIADSFVDHQIYYCGQESFRRNGVALIVNKTDRNAVLGCNLKNNRMISICFQGNIQYHGNPSLCPNQ